MLITAACFSLFLLVSCGKTGNTADTAAEGETPAVVILPAPPGKEQAAGQSGEAAENEQKESGAPVLPAEDSTLTTAAETGFPQVMVQPLPQEVDECGSAVFEAWAANTYRAEWIFISPDGRRKLSCDEADGEFRRMQIQDGTLGSLQLKNIPAEADGWKIVCRFFNDAGYTDTDQVLLTVKKLDEEDEKMDLRYQLPVVLRDPGSCTVEEGGSCSLEAAYRNAVWASWYFVSPDDQVFKYSEVNRVFPGLQVIDGMYSSMTLKNVPAGMDGWQVFCRYTNYRGYTDTQTALISVTLKDPE